MIASSSVTLRARSSRSACKSWNICKLMSYQRAATGREDGVGVGHCVRVGAQKHRPGSWGCSRLFPAPCLPPSVQRAGTVGVWALFFLPPPPPTFEPCLKLTLPQASYSPWIPIIVSRIKTLSAKIFSASLIWCIPSPCEDRYSCQGKGEQARGLLATMQVNYFVVFSNSTQYSS